MKQYRKIDFFVLGDYFCTTTRSQTLKEARKRFFDDLDKRMHQIGGLTSVESYIFKHPKTLKLRYQK